VDGQTGDGPEALRRRSGLLKRRLQEGKVVLGELYAFARPSRAADGAQVGVVDMLVDDHSGLVA